MIRVLQVLETMDRGGVETTLMNIFRNLDRSKIVFDFLLQTDRECHYNNEIRALGGKIFSVTPRRNSLSKNTKELKMFFREHKEYKIVHMHVSSLTYIKPLEIAKKNHVPVRIIHSRNTHSGGNSKIHIILHHINKLRVTHIANYYFSCSEEAALWLYPKRILKSPNYRQINNGIQTSKFKFNSAIRKRIRKELNCEDRIALVNVGRLHKQKNQLFLIDIFKSFIQKHPLASLYIIGEGKLKEELENKIRDDELSKNVYLLGNRPDVSELLQGMDIFIMPSLYEGLPGSVIEAQGASLPCLISDTITRSVKLTNLVHFLSIKKPASYWAEKAFGYYHKNVRVNTSQDIINAGFDMTQISRQLSEFYSEKYNEN